MSPAKNKDASVAKKSSTPKKSTKKPVEEEQSIEEESEATADTKKQVKRNAPKIDLGNVNEGKAGAQMVKGEEVTICIIRVRGSPGMRRTILNTLSLFNLHHVNHATIVRTNKSILGMLQKAKDYIAYGIVTPDIISKLLKRRGLLVGNKPLTDGHVKFATEYDSIDNLAKAIYDGKAKLRDVKDLKPIFRLHPPIGGFHKSIKKNVNAGGILGNHGDKIELLIKKML
jgi:large subunit ribosomal protein L30